MGLGDWIFLAALLAVGALGALVGFGKCLKFLTGGVVGIIISVILCYCFGGMILDIPFVSQLLRDLASNWAHIGWLTSIHPEIIIYYIALFILTILLRKLLVFVIQHVAETDVLVIKVINKTFGAIVMCVLGLTLMFFAFQIIAWIGGSTAMNFHRTLLTSGNAILRPLYENNPMSALVDLIKNAISQ